MTSITLTVTGARAWASVTGPLTSGMVGIPVTIEYDEAWDGLTKNLVCRCSPWGADDGEARVILNVEKNATVAHEVMKSDMYLYLGIEGFSNDGKLVIPTTWAKCGKIQYGANTCEDPSTNPELPVWNQLQTEIEKIKRDTVTQEQLTDIQICAQAAVQAASSAAQAQKAAEAAAEAAAGSAQNANAAAEAAEEARAAAVDAAADALGYAEDAEAHATAAKRSEDNSRLNLHEAEVAAQNAEAAARRAEEAVANVGQGSGNSGQNPAVVAVVVDYDKNVKAVAHRGYSTEAPENTLPAYILAKQRGYHYAECDVSFTSDGVAVLLHDSTIDRTSNGSGSISSLTYAEVAQYDFGAWKSAEYAGTKIPTFAEFIKLCRNIGMHPYIELKNNGGYSQETVNGLVDIVKAAGMGGKVTWISYRETFLGYVKNADPAARLGYLADTTTEDMAIEAVAAIQSLQADGNEVFADLALVYLNSAKIRHFIDAGIPVEAYYISADPADVSAKILAADPYISGFCTDVCIAGKVLYDAHMQWGGNTGGGESGGSGGGDTGGSDDGGESGGEYPGNPETTGSLVHSWDFTQGLTDSVGGYTAELSGATQDSSGLHLNAANNFARLCDDLTSGDIVEVDVGALNAQDWGGKHGRLICLTDWDGGYESGHGTYGIVYRNTGEWNIYLNPWGTGGILTDIAALANKTVRIDTGTGIAYADGVMFADNDGWRSDAKYLLLGASEQAYFNATILAVRVYRMA